MGPDSDVDLLVVMPEGTYRLPATQHLHTRMFGLLVPVDIVVVTPDDLRWHGRRAGLVHG